MIKPAHLVEALPPPVLVAGCHRSGTTVVPQLLRDAEIFVGGDLDANLESRFFIEQNSFILRACGGSWDWPEAVPFLLNDESLTSGMQAYLQRALTRRERKRVAAPSDSSGAWG